MKKDSQLEKMLFIYKLVKPMTVKVHYTIEPSHEERQFLQNIDTYSNNQLSRNLLKLNPMQKP